MTEDSITYRVNGPESFHHRGRPHGFIKPDNDGQVFFYEQDCYVLSNFSSFRLKWRGIDFDTSEHAYHWEKFVDAPQVQALILASRSAHEAFSIAQQHRQARVADWDAIKEWVMLRLLKAKVAQHPYVRTKLLSTGDKQLIEDSWRDNYWGGGSSRDGQNRLGALWMAVRDLVRTTAPDQPLAFQDACHICKRPLDDPRDPTTRNCGGDCQQCMTEAGDPDCASVSLDAGARTSPLAG